VERRIPAGCQVPQTFDGVPHPCGFQGADFDFVLTSSFQLLTCAFPLAIRMLLPQPCDQLLMRTETNGLQEICNAADLT
jgi:hypothetical protein